MVVHCKVIVFGAVGAGAGTCAARAIFVACTLMFLFGMHVKHKVAAE